MTIKLFMMLAGAGILIAVAVSLFFVSFNFGFVVLVGAGLALIAYGRFFDVLIRIKWLNFSIIAALALFFGLVIFLAAYGNRDTATFEEDAVIVLGTGSRGERVTRLLAYRLDKAAEYCEKSPKALIVVSGGQGAGEAITEALAMERYLLQRGVPQERIIKEEASTSTYENLVFSKAILDNRFSRPYKTVIVTNAFHMYRAGFLAKRVGVDAARYHAGMLWRSVPVNYSRECLAVLKTWVAGK
jgi:uncharacterized SAM-binding protein YcdF (DUF218 family)